MAGPVVVAAALSRVVTIRCPWCGYQKAVARSGQPVSYRVCSRCKRHYPDPLAAPTRKKR